MTPELLADLRRKPALDRHDIAALFVAIDELREERDSTHALVDELNSKSE